MSALTPEELNRVIECCLEGSQSHCAKLYRHYCKEVARFIGNRVRDLSVVEDIMQTTFLKAFNGLHRLKNRAAFKGWLYKIAKNETINYFKKKNMENKHFSRSIDEVYDDGNPLMEPADTSAAILDQYIYHEEKITIKSILEKLSQKEKEAILLREEGYTYREIAQKLKIKEKSIPSFLYNARIKVKTKLKRLNT